MSRLYTTDILRLAADSAGWSRLDAPTASAERRSPTCGSRIVVDVTLDAEGRVTAYGHEVRACALGQASSTLLAKAIIGRDSSEIGATAVRLRAYLIGASDAAGDWPGVEVFAPARSFPARHAAILLAFDAAAEAAKVS